MSDGKVIIQIDSNAKTAAQDVKQLDNAIKDLNKDTQQTKTQTDNVSNSFSGASSSIFTLKNAAIAAAGAFAAMKLTQMAGDIFKISSQFEQLNVAFEVLAGKSAGQQLVKDLTDLANVTPMTTQGLADNARLLLSFGEASQNVIGDLKMLGDISGGNQEKMNSLSLAFAQMGATGRLSGQDLLQMVNAGFNPLQQMSEKTGKSMGQLKKEMEDGKISFSMIKQSMIEATSEGGRFYGMMDKQSQTLMGRMSTMSDKFGLVAKSIGDILLPQAKKAVDAFTSLADKMLKTDAQTSPLNANIKNLSDTLGITAHNLKTLFDAFNFFVPIGKMVNGTVSTMVINFERAALAIQMLLSPLALFKKGGGMEAVSEEFQQAAIKYAATGKKLEEQLHGIKNSTINFKIGDITDINKKIPKTVKTSSGGFKDSTPEVEKHAKKVKEADTAYDLFQKRISKTTEELQVMSLQGQAGTKVFQTKKGVLDGYRKTLDDINKSLETSKLLEPYAQLQSNLEKATTQMQNLAAQSNVDLPAFRTAKENATKLREQIEAVNLAIDTTKVTPYQELSKNIEKMKTDLENMAVGGQAGTPAFEKMKNDYVNATNQMKQANNEVANAIGVDWGNIAESIKTDLASAFTTPLQEGETAFQRLGNIAMNTLSMIGQKMVENLLKEITLTQVLNGVKMVGKALSFGLFANGDVFSGGKPQAFANGGVVSSPTMFPMGGGGTGLMGEAGAEAIMPLRRINGRLGVEASNVQPNINIYNQTNAQIETSKRPNGDMDIRIREINNALANERTQQGLSVGMARQQGKGITAA